MPVERRSCHWRPVLAILLLFTARLSRCARVGLLPLLMLLVAAPVFASHVPPWDTGHQSFDADPGVQQTDPGSDSPCRHASPLEVATGNFIRQITIFFTL